MSRDFTVPDSWIGRAVFVRFDGAYGHSEVSVNGEYAGSHGSGATSWDLDLSPFLKAGTNRLTVTIDEYSPQSVIDYMAWYAHMSLLGIWRDVYLFSTDQLHLGDLGVVADYDSSVRTRFARRSSCP